ncbi:hypothetical protein DL96DRAFT_1679214 [Flagelloscypha sp. PMI_526]|nr:hypothetical protein DL96DRAFT_1679214 [Flagelloscypha sp. PMI_526]
MAFVGWQFCAVHPTDAEVSSRSSYEKVVGSIGPKALAKIPEAGIKTPTYWALGELRLIEESGSGVLDGPAVSPWDRSIILHEFGHVLGLLPANPLYPVTKQIQQEGAANVDILNLEFAPNFKIILDSWNMKTNVWLRECVYKRVTPKGKKPGFRSSMMTFGTSALWRVYDITGTVFSIFVLNYIVVPFMTLTLSEFPHRLDASPLSMAISLSGAALVFFYTGGGKFFRLLERR